MPRANWEFIGTSHIPYPTDTEQSRIASFLDAKCAQIDAIIEKQRQVIEKLKAYKQSVITEVVTKGLDPSVPMKDSGVEWIGMVPEGWSIPKINYCFTSIGSGTTPSSDDESFYNGPIYWIQSGDINGGVLTTTQKTITEQAYANYSALRIHKQPFIVVAMYGASIGNPSLSTIDACTNQACCVLGGSQNNIDFMFYVMVAAKAALVYSGKGGTQPNISQDIIKKLRIPQPTPLEQVHIAEYLREKCYVIEKTLEKKLSVIDKLTDYKKSLIYEAVTGKMEV